MYLHRNELPPKYGEYEENCSSKILSCIRTRANTGPACIGAKNEFPQKSFLHVLVLCRGGPPLIIAYENDSRRASDKAIIYADRVLGFSHSLTAKIRPPPPTLTSKVGLVGQGKRGSKIGQNTCFAVCLTYITSDPRTYSLDLFLNLKKICGVVGL